MSVSIPSMTRTLFAIVLLGLVAMTACESQDASASNPSNGFSVNSSDPANVVDAVFEAAKTGNASLLKGLCNPAGTFDLDARRICDYASGFDKEGEFPMFFARGKRNGEVQQSGDQASVPFLFGPNGDKPDTMDLVKRDGKWYIECF